MPAVTALSVANASRRHAQQCGGEHSLCVAAQMPAMHCAGIANATSQCAQEPICQRLPGAALRMPVLSPCSTANASRGSGVPRKCHVSPGPTKQMPGVVHTVALCSMQTSMICTKMYAFAPKKTHPKQHTVTTIHRTQTETAQRRQATRCNAGRCAGSSAPRHTLYSR